MPDGALMTAADIARLAGVTRATVSNWRRRHPDFPEPVGGTESSPAYDRVQVEAWLAARGSLPELPPLERLWRRIVQRTGTPDLDAVAWAIATACEAPTPSVGNVVPKEGELLQDLAEAIAKYGARDTVRFLIDKYIEETGRAILATPSPVATLMAHLGDTGGKSVLDPACGTGELLSAAAAQGAVRVLGQDIDDDLVRLTQLRLNEFAHALTVDIVAGDSLHDDKFHRRQADVVLCHPPFGIRDWGHDELAYDSRWEYGTPPRAESELAWAQHALSHLRLGARAIMLMPPAVASRPSGRRIRAEMLRRGAIRAVASLPPGSVYPRHVGVHLWVLERPAEELPPDPRTLFISSTGDIAEASDSILRVWKAFRTGESGAGEPGIWRTVPVIDLLDEEVNLTPARHVATRQPAESPEEISEAIKAARTKFHDAFAAVGDAFPSGDWTLRSEARRWRTAAVADLARGGRLEVRRASPAAPADEDLVDEIDPDDGWPVLTLRDVIRGGPPTAAEPGGVVEPGWIKIRVGDVIIPAITTGTVVARVAEGEDEEAVLGRNLHLIRPNPHHVDSWFLKGFLATPDNFQRASYGSTVTRIDIRRLEMPLLPLPEQQLYGQAFRHLESFDAVAERITRLAGEMTADLRRSLVQGILRPPEHEANPAHSRAPDG
jgi:SAM-dependent methyltransferase